MKYILAIILGVLLYGGNPTETDFEFFMKEEVQSRISEENSFAKALVGGIVTDALKQGTYRKDYLLFSKFIVDTSLIAAFRKDVPPRIEFIGVLGYFVPLTKF